MNTTRPGRGHSPPSGAPQPGRRRLLRLTAGAGLALGTGCASNAGSPAPGDPAGVVPTPSPSPTASPVVGVRVPKVNGGINVHPLRRLGAVSDEEVVIDPQLVALQTSAVYQLGFYGMRITVPLVDEGSHVRRLVWVTESGVAGTALRLPWVRDTFPQILEQIGDASRIFYYDLYDPDPRVYRLFDIRDEGGTYVPVAESGALYQFFDDELNAAAAGRPLLGFDTLVPDIRLYFPTPADIAAYEQVRGIGARA